MARIKLQPANNVVATGKATIDLNNLLGYTLERLLLELGGTFTASMITLIQMIGNSKVLWESTGARIASTNAYKNTPANAAYLVLDFSEIRAKTELGQFLGAIDTTVGIRNLKLEVTIAGATAPTLGGFAEVNRPQTDPAQAATRGLIARRHSSTVTIGAAGTFGLPIPHFPVADGGSVFKRINFFSANMTAILLKKNGVAIEEVTKAQNDFNQTEYKKVPQSGLFCYDAIIKDNQSQALSTRDAQTMEALGTFSAGETITIEIESLEPLDAF